MANADCCHRLAGNLLHVRSGSDDAIRPLVLVAAAYRIRDDAAAAQRRHIDAIAEGRPVPGTWSGEVSSPVGAKLLAPSIWLFDPLARPRDPSDMVAFARAEEAFDLGRRLK